MLCSVVFCESTLPAARIPINICVVQVVGRLTQRSDDTEDKCRNRLAVSPLHTPLSASRVGVAFPTLLFQSRRNSKSLSIKPTRLLLHITQVHARNVNSVSALYKNCIKEINGDRDKKVVFEEIDQLLSQLR